MTLTLETVAKLANANAYRYDWVFTYMTEETAQHRGHLDIVVEWVDGRVGHSPSEDPKPQDPTASLGEVDAMRNEHHPALWDRAVDRVSRVIQFLHDRDLDS